MTQVEDGAGISTFSYATGRLQSVDGPWENDTLTYGYDSLGRMVSLQPEGGQQVTHTYDPLNRLEKITTGTAEYNYSYQSAISPLVQQLTRPNGVTTQYDYDPLNRLLAITNSKSNGEIITKHAYTYNEKDLRGSEEISGGLAAPVHPEGVLQAEFNQLSQLTETVNPDQDFTYDADGNMTKGSTPEGYVFSAAYDGADRLHSIVFTDDQGKVQRRVYTYFWNGFPALQDRGADNQVLREYTWGLNFGGGIIGLLALRQGGQDYSYLYDGKGNVGTVVDGSAQSVATYRYGVFGKLVALSGTLNQPFQFSSERYDAQTGWNGVHGITPGLVPVFTAA
jgi:YD repeat-containing protein